MDKLAGDFVNLPIIITDYDALLAKSSSQRTSPSSPSTGFTHQEHERLPQSGPSSTTSVSSTAGNSSAQAQAQQWSTGFSEFADELWNRMTGSMREKLRKACVETLRRTEDPKEEEKVAWMWDEDAKLLD